MNSVILRKGKKRRKRKQNEVSEELYFWCSVMPVEVTIGGFSWWGEIRPLTLPRCSFTMPWQHLPHLLNNWPNAHPGKVTPHVPPALHLLHFLSCPRGGISAAPIVQVQRLCAAGVEFPAAMGLKVAQLLDMLYLFQGFTTTWQHSVFQASTFNDLLLGCVSRTMKV